jgi:hypothetical protein
MRNRAEGDPAPTTEDESLGNLIVDRLETHVIDMTVGGGFITEGDVDPVRLSAEVRLLLGKLGTDGGPDIDSRAVIEQS